MTAYKLALYGADTYGLATELYRSRSKQKTELIAKCINAMRFYNDDKVSLICITREILAEVGLESNDTEGIIDYAIAVKGVEIGVSICEEKSNEYKVSFRSRTRNVGDIASIFGGGGHMYAAGCRIFGKKEDVIDKILKAIRDTEAE